MVVQLPYFDGATSMSTGGFHLEPLHHYKKQSKQREGSQALGRAQQYENGRLGSSDILKEEANDSERSSFKTGMLFSKFLSATHYSYVVNCIRPKLGHNIA